MTKYIILGSLAVGLFAYVFALGDRYGLNASRYASSVKQLNALNGKLAVFDKKDGADFAKEVEEALRQANDFKATKGLGKLTITAKQAAALEAIKVDE